jgi:hypothetical protein
MFIDANTSREDLQVAIINEDALYRRFDEKRFLNDGYTTEELLASIQAWIAEGDECASS